MKTILAIALLAATAAAQTKVSGTGKCGKADVQPPVEVGDRAGHTLAIVKGSCTFSAPIEMEGVKGKDYTVAIMSDMNGAKAQDRGYVVVTMENGDKAFVRTSGSSTMSKDGKMEGGEGTWSYAGGTGKFRGLTGKGTYKTKPASDGGGEDQIDGEYSLPAAKPAAKAPAKK